jgi:hypothetical protein
MAQRDNRHFGLDCTPPDRRPYGPLSGAAKTPLGPDQVNVHAEDKLSVWLPPVQGVMGGQMGVGIPVFQVMTLARPVHRQDDKPAGAYPRKCLCYTDRPFLHQVRVGINARPDRSVGRRHTVSERD